MIDYDKLWEEIDNKIKEEVIANKLPHERTKAELVETWGLSRYETEKEAERLVASGVFGTRKAKLKNGRVVNVYYPSVN